MSKIWLLSILAITLALLANLKSQELRTLTPFINYQRALKLPYFAAAYQDLSLKEIELLELWESILTGRSAPLAKWMKEVYGDLGLKHIFTPSGFHLSAVLSPFMKISTHKGFHLGLLSLVGIILCFLPSMAALKRMVLIKGAQRLSTKKMGFILALLLDILVGSFQGAPLSFSYSFLFLGIIYSGARGLGLIFWFFLGQVILAYFQGNLISPLLLFWSPLLNFAFGLAMPLLFILAFPLWDWQLSCGLWLLKIIQQLVLLAFATIKSFPLLEVHLGILLFLALFCFRHWQYCSLLLLMMVGPLNTDNSRNPTFGSYEFRPSGAIIRVKGDAIFYQDGKCKLRLVRGHWWELCTPKRSRRNK